jgi:alpha-glucosidase (family GH31 glycosyl hydrolase)
MSRERVVRAPRRPTRRRVAAFRRAAPLVAGVAGVVVVLGIAAPARAHNAPVNSASGPGVTHFTDQGSSLVLTRSATFGAPGYRVVIAKSPFQVTTVRDHRTVLATTGASPTAAAVRFAVGATSYRATHVTSARWHGGALNLQLATTDPGVGVSYTVTPQADRYRVHWRVTNEPRVVSSVGGDYALASAGDWYGEGIVENDQGAPYGDQPWPLSSGEVNDNEVGPFSYFVHNPFWFTRSAAGIWVDTDKVMNVQINVGHSGRASLLVTNSTHSNDSDVGAPTEVGQARTYDATVFVESTPRAVYQDYVGIAGKPRHSDTTALQYKTPMWNDWGDLALGVTQASFLHYAQSLVDNHLPGHTVELDDGWAAGYADHVFNQPAKFPDPKAMIAKVHKMGFDFGLWDTFYDNRNGDRASVLWPTLDSKGYLLKAVSNPIPFGTHSSCATTWFGGGSSDHPGLVDLGNPAARAWLKGQIDGLAKKYGIDGWKFDTQIYDPKCQPYPGRTKMDYLRIGLDFIDQYNLTGQGMITSAWTGTQRYGFATDSIDKDADWGGLQAAAHQALAISTIGYPFTEMDMIGGSDGSDPPNSPTKPVLVRWAQAEALTPLMMGSVNPTRYDQQTIDLYRDAIHLHERLWPYLMKQVARAVASGEPIMKPIFFNYPGDQKAYAINDEWLFGDSLLAAPVLADVTSRNIHVPAGTWYDVRHRCVLAGSTDVPNYHVTLADVPMFVKLHTKETDLLLKALAPGKRVGANTAHC